MTDPQLVGPAGVMTVGAVDLLEVVWCLRSVGGGQGVGLAGMPF